MPDAREGSPSSTGPNKKRKKIFFNLFLNVLAQYTFPSDV